MASIFKGGHSSQEGAFGIGAYEEADDEEVYSTDNMGILFIIYHIVIIIMIIIIIIFIIIVVFFFFWFFGRFVRPRALRWTGDRPSTAQAQRSQAWFQKTYFWYFSLSYFSSLHFFFFLYLLFLFCLTF